MAPIVARAGLFRIFSWLLLLTCCPLQAQRWQLQYFFDQKDSSLEIRDLVFPSPNRGIAVGTIIEGRSRRPVCLTTSDGGARWTLAPLREAGESLFFLDENIGFMTTPGGIWKSVVSGRGWFQLPSAPRGVKKVYFANQSRGWAVGERKSVHETADGGKSWRPLPALEQVNTRPETTVFREIAFAGDRMGIIVGHSTPAMPPRGLRRIPSLPDPVQPGPPQRERPHLMIVLQTSDGGKTWKASTTSVFGSVRQVVFLPDGGALLLLQFLGEFSVPSEIHRMPAPKDSSSRVFARADRAVADIAADAGGSVILAAIEPPGTRHWGPVPGKVKVLRSLDLKDWMEMEVDYRAVARAAVLAVLDQDHAWIATDTGMILRLTRP
ncbi:MAG: YCF48-related protein [Bryobacteraceae bacterium]